MPENHIRFQYTYHFSVGSVPPPYHYEYDLFISDQGGMLEYWDDYRSPNMESKKFFFKLDQTKIINLRNLISSIGYRTWEKPTDSMIGGATEWVDGEDGFFIPAQLKKEDQNLAGEVFSQIKELVPSSLWKEIKHEIPDSLQN